MKVTNDSGKDITGLSLLHRVFDWKQGETLELTEAEWSLVMGDTTLEKESAREFWRGVFPDALPHLIPHRSKKEE